MIWIVLGCFAFVLLTLFDLNKRFKWHPILNSLFPISIGLLITSLVCVYLEVNSFGSFQSYPLFYGLVVIGALEQIYTLFFALPAQTTYASLDTVRLVNTGFYGCCRHPGVWGFILMAIGFTFGSGSMLIAITAVSWTLMDILHVLIQDVFIFPHSIPGYTLYQSQVPFLGIRLTGFKK